MFRLPVVVSLASLPSSIERQRGLLTRRPYLAKSFHNQHRRYVGEFFYLKHEELESMQHSPRWCWPSSNPTQGGCDGWPPRQARCILRHPYTLEHDCPFLEARAAKLTFWNLRRDSTTHPSQYLTGVCLDRWALSVRLRG